MEQIRFSAPCLLGVEGLVADELKRMQAQDVQAENGRVFFSGDFNMLARANICSRYSERIQIFMGSFKAVTFEELFQGVKKMPWGDFIGKQDAYPVKGRSLNSKLTSLPSCQSIIKKAVTEKLKEKYRIPWFEETGATFQIQFLIMKDLVYVMIDTSGAGLHKRGYRANSTLAPIKETIAATMANLAHVRGDSIVYDPLCGSGTILIESAMVGLNIAPGLKRRFAAERWNKLIPSSVWVQERKRAQELIRTDRPFIAYGSDIDDEAVKLSTENIYKAGLEKRIVVERADVRDFECKTDKGIIICNPPYGERLLDAEQAKKIYEILGNKFERKTDWSCNIISPDEEFEKSFGQKADKRRKIYNGMIKCQYYMYFKNS